MYTIFKVYFLTTIRNGHNENKGRQLFIQSENKQV